MNDDQQSAFFVCKVIVKYSLSIHILKEFLLLVLGYLLRAVRSLVNEGLTRPRIELVPAELFFLVREKMLTAITSEPPSELF